MRKDTRARDFDRNVKLAISERDSIDGWPCCVYCGTASPGGIAWSNAHYIARSQGGLGIEKNGLTLCPDCHRRYDQTTAREQMRVFLRNYLRGRYEDWDEKDLVYRKGRT